MREPVGLAGFRVWLAWNWARHRFYGLYQYIEPPPLTWRWYVRGIIALAITSFMLAWLLPSILPSTSDVSVNPTHAAELVEPVVDGKVAIAIFALMVSGAAFFANYTSSISPPAALRVRFDHTFGTDMGFAPDDPDRPNRELPRILAQHETIVVVNQGKDPVQVGAIWFETLHERISATSITCREFQVDYPIVVPAGEQVGLPYSYRMLVEFYARTGIRSRPWLVVALADGREQYHPVPALIVQDVERVKPVSRPELGRQPWWDFEHNDMLESHVDRVTSYLSDSVMRDGYLVRHAFDPNVECGYRKREDDQWGPIFTFPDLASCIVHYQDHDDGSHEVIFISMHEHQQRVIAIGTDRELTFVTTDREFARWGRLKGGPAAVVLEALPAMTILGVLAIRYPQHVEADLFRQQTKPS